MSTRKWDICLRVLFLCRKIWIFGSRNLHFWVENFISLDNRFFFSKIGNLCKKWTLVSKLASSRKWLRLENWMFFWSFGLLSQKIFFSPKSNICVRNFILMSIVGVFSQKYFLSPKSNICLKNRLLARS